MNLETLTLAELFTQQSKISAVIASHFSTVVTSDTPVTPTSPQAPVDTVVVAPDAPVADVSPQAPVDTVVVTADTELDDEGFPWDERIHSASKSKIKSKIVKGDAWRPKRGLKDPELVAKVRAEYKPNIANHPTTTAEYTAPTLANAPVAPQAPQAPQAPVAPQAPTLPNTPAIAPDIQAVKKSAINVINKIVSEFTVDYSDIMTLVKEDHGVDSFEELTVEMYSAVNETMTNLYDSYVNAQTILNDLYKMAGETYQASVDEVVKGFYTEVQAGALGEVFYKDLPSVTEKLTNYRQSWFDGGFTV